MYLLFPVRTSSLTPLTIQCCNAAKNVPQCFCFVPFCKSLFISFLTNSVEFPLCLWLITPYYLQVPLHYYHKSLPAGRKFPQATVLLTWQQFPDSSFEMLATLSAPEHELKQQSVNIEWLSLSIPSILICLSSVDLFFLILFLKKVTSESSTGKETLNLLKLYVQWYSRRPNVLFTTKYYF